jgi:hypothetical protein
MIVAGCFHTDQHRCGLFTEIIREALKIFGAIGRSKAPTPRRSGRLD